MNPLVEHLPPFEEGNAYTLILGVPPYKEEAVESEGAHSFYAVPNKIELEATNPESPIAKFIEKRGEGIHHVAYAVEDIKAEMALSRRRRVLSNKEPKAGADNKWVCFLHPKGTGGNVNELCQDRG